MRVGIGQDSHRFDFENKSKKLVLGGIVVEDAAPLLGNSDGDVVLHSITNAISGVTSVNILGEVADNLCLKEGVLDSSVYLKEALKYLKDARIVHISLSIECKKPKITPLIPALRKNIATLLDLPETSVGITATSGEGLTQFGMGEGIQVLSVVTVL